MDIQEKFREVLEKYPGKGKPARKDSESHRLIEIDLPEALKMRGGLPKEFLIKGSIGEGITSEVPWIRIYEQEISPSAHEEYYIVYLFNSKMNGFYISLNQGVTQYNELYGPSATQAMRKNTEKLKTKIIDLKEKFSFEGINLDAKQKLGNDYELCHICGKYYPRGNIPEDSVLMEDLRDLVEVYEKVKETIGNSVLNIDENYTIEERDKIRSRNRKISHKDIIDLELLKRREARMREGFEEATQEEYDRLCKRIDEFK